MSDIEGANHHKGCQQAVVEATASIVTAIITTAPARADNLDRLIGSVGKALWQSIGMEPPTSNGHAAEPSAKPAVPVKKSVMPDFIICLEDGKKLKMLKRYLRSRYGLTPEEYRAKWGLPIDYPMVAPNYAAQRSTFAKQIGLGKTPAKKGARR